MQMKDPVDFMLDQLNAFMIAKCSNSKELLWRDTLEIFSQNFKVLNKTWFSFQNLSLSFAWLAQYFPCYLDTENVKKEDVTFSFLRSLGEVQGHLAYVHALAHQVRKVFFVGSFINIPLVRRFFTEEIQGRNLLRPKVKISFWQMRLGDGMFWFLRILILVWIFKDTGVSPEMFI